MEASASSLSIVQVQWTPAFRVIPRYPPIAHLEAFDSDLQAAVVAELASIHPEIIGDIRLAPSGLPTGPGASRLITAYTFCRPGRFNDESFGAFYGAESLSTAISETKHHIARALLDSGAPAQKLPTRLVLHVDVETSNIVDARALRSAALHDTRDYTYSQRFGAAVRARGHDGIVYRSVRRAGGQCVAIYVPIALKNCRDDMELEYRYADGIIEVSEDHHPGEP